MSDERFDNLIRRKLQTPQPAPDRRRWDRFRGLLPVAVHSAWWARYGGWAAGGLLAVGLVGALTLFVQLNERINRLEQENRLLLLSRQPRTVTAQSPRLPVVGATPGRTDTVYIVRRTVVEHRYPVSTKTGSSVVGKNELAGHTLAASFQRDPAGFGLASVDLATGTGKLNALPEGPAVAGEIPAIATNEQKKPETAPRSDPEKTAVVIAKPTFRLASLRPRLGLEGDAASHGVWSVGPSVELFLNENLSLSTGVSIAQQRAENHQKLRGFNSATGRNFEETYRPHLPERYDQIDEIRIQTSAVRLPIHLNYYAPLRRNWSLAFSVGTLLDMSVYQAVQFESYYAGSEQFNSFEVNARNKVFHNLVFGTGLQYQRGRLSARMTPFLLYDFRGTDYSAPGSKLGLKGSVWLNLYR